MMSWNPDNLHLCVSDIDECDDPLRCPGKECVNTQGSYNCVPCKPGFGLLNGQCSGVLNQHTLNLFI